MGISSFRYTETHFLTLATKQKCRDPDRADPGDAEKIIACLKYAVATDPLPLFVAHMNPAAAGSSMLGNTQHRPPIQQRHAR